MAYSRQWITPLLVTVSLLWFSNSFGLAERPVTLDDLLKIQQKVVTLKLSPDGSLIAYAIGDDGIWIKRTKGRDSTSRLIAKGFMPVWSPDGSRVAYYSSAGNDGLQLWVFDVTSNRSSQLTSVAGGIDPDPTSRISRAIHDSFRFAWSPDGTRLAFASRARTARNARTRNFPANPAHASGDAAAPLILTATTPPEWTLSGIFVNPIFTGSSAESKDGFSFTAKDDSIELRPVLSNQIFTIHTQTRELRRVTNDDASYFDPQWNTDGSEIVCASSDKAGPIYGVETINIYSIRVGTGEKTALTSGPGVRFAPTWSSTGSMLAFLHRKSFFGHTAINIIHQGGQGSIDVTYQLDRDVQAYQWSGGSIFFIYTDAGSHPIGRVSLDTRKVDLSAPIANTDFASSATEISVTREGALAWFQEDSRSPGIIRFSRSSKKNKVLVDLFPEVQHLKLGSVQQIRWTNSLGEKRQGSILLPLGYKKGTRYPLIVDAYPLVGASSWFEPMMGNQAWAALGYAVFRPSPRAPHAWMNPWTSEASSLAGKGPGGWNLAVDDVLSGVDEVLAREIADENRMCLYGFSNGGGVVNYLVTRTNRFKCAVSVGGVLPNWVGSVLLNTDEWEATKTFAGADIWESPDTYVQLSAVFRLNNVATPILLVDGDKSGPFLLGSVEMYNGLRHAGADVTFLRYPTEGHVLGGEALKDFWQRELAFFSQHLVVDGVH